MKIKRVKSLLSYLAAVIIASMLSPIGVLIPSPAGADPGIMRWDMVSTPNSVPNRNDILNPYISDNFTGSEIRDLAVGSDGRTLLAAVTVDGRYVGLGAVPVGALMVSANGGISWSMSAYQRLAGSSGWTRQRVYNVIIAPDDSKV
jgi:hypothetical protein